HAEDARGIANTFANMLGHMAYDTQVFSSTRANGGHVKKSSSAAEAAYLRGAVPCRPLSAPTGAPPRTLGRDGGPLTGRRAGRRPFAHEVAGEGVESARRR